MAVRSLSVRRKVIYAAVLTAVSLAVLLVALEVSLRVMGYGYSPRFTRREKLPDGPAVWRENRWCTAPYFSPALVRRPQPFRLSEKKEPGAIRIFVLGSSAAMGDPEASFSISRMLETMLRAAYPQQKFEVVNAAVTAINSHLVRGIAEDCAQLEPDLFIVYEGHNEVIGPFGPAGVFTVFLHRYSFVRAAVWLKGTRTGQLLAALSRPARARKDWGGMEMFLQQKIAHDDPRLEAVRRHFRTNVLAIAKSAQKVGASTLVCTALANQRDFAPFLSLHRADLTAAALREWEDHFERGNDAARLGDRAQAEAAYRAAIAIDDQHAETTFRLGRVLLQRQDPEAAVLFQRALDLDALRFRADTSLNETIRDLAGDAVRGLRVIDLVPDLTAAGLTLGDGLFYEHVHLTFAGTYEIARQLLAHVAGELSARGLVPQGKPALLSADDARQRLAFTTYEQAMIAIELRNRFQRPPFTGQSDHAQRLEKVTKRIATAQALLGREDALPSLRASYEQAIAITPNDWVLKRNAGMMLVARGAPADAVPFLEQAAAWIADDVDTLIALGRAYKAVNRENEAATTLRKARELEPRHPAFAETP